MGLKSKNPTTTEAWKKLNAHFVQLKDKHMKGWFNEDPETWRVDGDRQSFP